MKLENEAKAYFDQHYNCAQSTLAPFAKRYGVDLDTVLKLSTPFGGGIGHSGKICGVVSGGIMAIGLAKGITVYDSEKKAACYDLAKVFQERFVELHGDLTCPGLLGLDIGDPEELDEAREQDLFHTLCPRFVADAARIVAEMLELED